MQARPRAPTKRYSHVHEVRILRYPLIRLAGAHRPAEDAVQVLDVEVVGD